MSSPSQRPVRINSAMMSSSGAGKTVCMRVVRHLADGLRPRPPVQLLRAAVPVGDDVVLVADEDGVVGEIEQRRLLPERLFRARPRGDLGVELRVAPREVRRPLLDPDLELIVRTRSASSMRRRRELNQPTRRADSAKTAMRRMKSKSSVIAYSGGVMKQSTTSAARRAASSPGPIPPSQALSTPAA